MMASPLRKIHPLGSSASTLLQYSKRSKAAKSAKSEQTDSEEQSWGAPASWDVIEDLNVVGDFCLPMSLEPRMFTPLLPAAEPGEPPEPGARPESPLLYSDYLPTPPPTAPLPPIPGSPSLDGSEPKKKSKKPSNLKSSVNSGQDQKIPELRISPSSQDSFQKEQQRTPIVRVISPRSRTPSPARSSNRKKLPEPQSSDTLSPKTYKPAKRKEKSSSRSSAKPSKANANSLPQSTQHVTAESNFATKEGIGKGKESAFEYDTDDEEFNDTLRALSSDFRDNAADDSIFAALADDKLADSVQGRTERKQRDGENDDVPAPLFHKKRSKHSRQDGSKSKNRTSILGHVKIPSIHVGRPITRNTQGGSIKRGHASQASSTTGQILIAPPIDDDASELVNSDETDKGSHLSSASGSAISDSKSNEKAKPSLDNRISKAIFRRRHRTDEPPVKSSNNKSDKKHDDAYDQSPPQATKQKKDKKVKAGKIARRALSSLTSTISSAGNALSTPDAPVARPAALRSDSTPSTVTTSSAITSPPTPRSPQHPSSSARSNASTPTIDGKRLPPPPRPPRPSSPQGSSRGESPSRRGRSAGSSRREQQSREELKSRIRVVGAVDPNQAAREWERI